MACWNWQKIKQMLNNTLKLNLCYLKTIHIVHQRYHPKEIWHILKNKQINKCVCIHEIIRLIIMKIKIKVKNRSLRYDVNRSKPRYSKYKKCQYDAAYMYLATPKQHLMINLWKSKATLRLVWKKALLIKKSVYIEILWLISSAAKVFWKYAANLEENTHAEAKIFCYKQWHNIGGKNDTRGIRKYVEKPTKVIPS